jgi:hypothetical protein
MRTVKSLLLIAPVALFCSCASTQNAQQVADFDGDGYISDAEKKQFDKQASVQERNVYTESTKRRNATNTVRDANQAVWGARSLLEGIRSF